MMSNKPVAVRPSSGAKVETLEGRQLLAVTAGKTITPGVTFRPASDVAPTRPPSETAVAARQPAGRQSRAYTHYLQVLPKNVAGPSAVGASGPVGLTAAQVRGAYGIDGVRFRNVVGDGAGQTIAIVTAYDHPGFVSSSDTVNYPKSDLAVFSRAMGLADPPSFTKIDQSGGTDYPEANAVWAAETALDVEWAHAMAPKANIVLVVANSNSFGDLVQNAVNTARNLPGVSVVSMSFGFDGGFAGENYFDQFFTTPAGHGGVSFVAAAGDHGAVTPAGGTTGSAAYPAESPNVLAVGGTRLAQSNGAFLPEEGWNGSGGGVSNFQNKPAYQSPVVTQSSTFRTTPDVSILGDPTTGVAVYDSYNNTTGGGWNNFVTGGTSLSAPLWAGVLAVANQGRSVAGLGSLNGPEQTQRRVYQLPQNTLRDLTTGNNGFAAGVGYDLVTGRGTPLGNATLQALAGGAYAGTAYLDRNGNAAFDAADTPLAGVTVFNDLDGDAALDGNESSAVTTAAGAWTLDVAAGLTLSVRALTPGGTVRTTAGTLGSGTTAYGGSGTPLGGFGFFPTTISLAAGTNAVTLRLSADGNSTQIFVNTSAAATPTYTIAKSLLTGLTFNGNSGNDTLTIDFANGSPLTSGTIGFNGGGQASADALVVTNVPSVAATQAYFSAADFAFAGRTVTVSGVEARAFVGRAAADYVVAIGTTAATSPVLDFNGGADRLTVTNGTFRTATDLGADGPSVGVTGTTGGSVVFAAGQRLASLELSGQAVAALAAGRYVLRTAALSINTAQGSALDLADGGLVYDYAAGASPAAAVAAWVAGGYAAGAWTGVGVRSSTAAAAANRVLGFGEAATALNLSGAATAAFLGQTVDSTTVLVRYTVRGDATLNGTTNFDDFVLLQTNFGRTGRSFAQGDFDYDGDTDFDDFVLLQTNFGRSV